MTRPQPGRAAVLIARILAAGEMSRDEMAQKLHLTDAQLDAYVTAREPMPLNLQARVALFVIANVPAFVTEGNRLRHQVAAAIAFDTQRTGSEEVSLRASR